MVVPCLNAGRPDSWYAATAPAGERHPVLAGRERADVCIVGAGFTGVSAALHLAERGYSVIVLETARVGWGASGRNGGQVGSGMRESMGALERSLGPERAGALWVLCEEAKEIIADRIARHRIRCDWRAGNLLASTRERYMGWIEREAEFCHRRFGYRGYRMLSRTEMREEVASTCYAGGRMDEGGGHLHPLRFVLGMAEAAVRAGARIFEGSRVERIRWGSRAQVTTAHGAVDAEYVVFAGNALSRPSGAENRIEDHADRQPCARGPSPSGNAAPAPSSAAARACIRPGSWSTTIAARPTTGSCSGAARPTPTGRSRIRERSCAGTCCGSSPSSRTFGSTTPGAAGSRSP